MKTTPKLIFSQSSLPLILEAFGKSVNKQGMIVEASGEPVLTPEGQELAAANFGGIKKGSEIFIKDDLLGIMNLAEGKY